MALSPDQRRRLLRMNMLMAYASFASSKAVAWTPATLFANAEVGGWYDPSDLTTLFQDAEGTTPVTAVEQPVGLVLDKSKGLALGPELVTNGDFSNGSTGWVGGLNSGQVTLDTSSGSAVLTVNSGYSANANGRYVQAISGLTIGRTYRIAVGSFSSSGSGDRFVGWTSASNGTAGVYWYIAVTTPRYYTATATTMYVWFGFNNATTGASITIDNISVRELPGSHLSQSTSTARPVLSARVNLLTRTEDFSHADWAKVSLVVATPTAVSADEVSFPAVSSAGDVSILRQAFTSVVTDYIGSIELKAKASGDIGKKIVVYINAKSNPVAVFHTLTDSYVRVTVSDSGTATTGYFSVGVLGSDYGGQNQGAVSINIRRADLRPANAGVGLPAYQRVGAATSGSSTAAGNADYDTTGFPLYLKFDGTDDFLQSSAIDPGSVDKAQVFSGIRKITDPTGYTNICETSVNSASTAGTFGLFGTANGLPRYGVGLTGSSGIGYDPQTYAAPITNVLAAIFDIGAAGISAENIPRINGVVNQTNLAGTTAGTGNFSSQPLYIGARFGTSSRSNFFNGQLYSLILRFSATNMDAATIASTETWVNSKTGAY